jgi:hypothetical protein
MAMAAGKQARHAIALPIDNILHIFLPMVELARTALYLMARKRPARPSDDGPRHTIQLNRAC